MKIPKRNTVVVSGTDGKQHIFENVIETTLTDKRLKMKFYNPDFTEINFQLEPKTFIGKLMTVIIPIERIVSIALYEIKGQGEACVLEEK